MEEALAKAGAARESIMRLGTKRPYTSEAANTSSMYQQNQFVLYHVTS
jgi:hypothetical protein